MDRNELNKYVGSRIALFFHNPVRREVGVLKQVRDNVCRLDNGKVGPLGYKSAIAVGDSFA